jgi:serine/threonine protein kinase
LLESASIIHRDLAARNFLVTENLKVLLSDFGMSKQLVHDDAIYRSKNSVPLAVKWCSPEVMKSAQFSFASDRYALGVTLWEIFNKGMFVYSFYLLFIYYLNI